MADQNGVDRRQFFQRLRPRAPGRELAAANVRIDRLPSSDPAIVRPLVIDWRFDVATSWEDGALVAYTQAGAMFRWDLSTAEIAFLRSIDGQRSIGSLHDAVAVEHPGAHDALAARLTLLTELLDANILYIVRDAPAPAGGD
jgi:hypothetical protein